MAGNLEKDGYWLRLDNAAKIYPAIQDDELTSVFRISAVLKDPVNAKALVETVNVLDKRFPYFKVKPKSGFFWYYLEHDNSRIPLNADVDVPCRAFGKDNLIFRVLAKKNTISVEFSHILTDGTGGFEFMKSLLYTYFKGLGMMIPGDTTFLRPDQTPSDMEFEDSYNKYFKEKVPVPKKKSKAFHLPYRLKTSPRFEILTAVLPLEVTSQKSKDYDVSITVYLVAVYLYALQEIYHSSSQAKKQSHSSILRVEVPINLRNIYPSKTMRNFSIFVLPEIDLSLGHYSFKEIVTKVYHLMQLDTDEKLISKIISRNVGAERNVWVKSIPLFIKSLVLYFKYKSAGTSLYSGVITNLGKINLSRELNDLIDYFVFIPPPPDKTVKVNCGVAGFGNKLVLSFGNITKCKELEQRFFKTLMEHGIPVKLIHY